MKELQLVLENLQVLRMDVLAAQERRKLDDDYPQAMISYLDGELSAYDSAIRVVERGITSLLGLQMGEANHG